MSATRVAIIDGGGANIASLRFALERLAVDSELTVDIETIRSASHVILPGVGAAADAMNRLRNAGLDRVIPELTQPVLGICLGLQLLFEASDEDDAECLGVLRGTARQFEAVADRPVPHMGWNQIARTNGSSGVGLLKDIPDGAYFYFVHSYALDVSAITAASADYGWEFSAVVRQNNFVATQFHPERSGAHGAALLNNFLTRD
ncbi:MAG: imidazole glycerol phosphate synthase subunit HisH [Gammaproteobacteria bacterium]